MGGRGFRGEGRATAAFFRGRGRRAAAACRFWGRGGARRRRAAQPLRLRAASDVEQKCSPVRCEPLSALRRHAGVSRPSPQLCCPAGRSRARRSANMARPQWRPICSAGRAPNRKLISQPISRDLRSTHLARGPQRCPSWRPFRHKVPRQGVNKASVMALVL